MSTIKPFQIFDILDYNNINLDILTETFNVGLYGKYIAKWPEFVFPSKTSLAISKDIYWERLKEKKLITLSRIGKVILVQLLSRQNIEGEEQQGS
ncbi:unnamed protein product [Paramecium octaurelia]|uniref:Uncharacterized protein n=1 Tax=Paramecium octaurelia TaxID=43137 RepID=A0A8S1T4J8_PAROT|nr:unnamed protein product [Paramecium octaurelia]